MVERGVALLGDMEHAGVLVDRDLRVVVVVADDDPILATGLGTNVGVFRSITQFRHVDDTLNIVTVALTQSSELLLGVLVEQQAQRQRPLDYSVDPGASLGPVATLGSERAALRFRSRSSRMAAISLGCSW
mgnify:CR=1 FL=1